MNALSTQVLDARGLNCPLPILRTKKALSELGTGETFAVISTDPGSLKDMQAFCKQTGHPDLVQFESGRVRISHSQGIRR